MMKKCLIYLDKEQLQNSIDLLEVARQMYLEEEYSTYGVILQNGSSDQVETNKVTGLFDYIIQIKDMNIQSFQVKALTDVLESVHGEYTFNSILIPATYIGRMLAPRLAMRLKVGLTADVTEIRHREGQLEMVRPAFSGRILAGIVSRSSEPIMMSIRQNVFNYNQPVHKNGEVIEHSQFIKPMNSQKVSSKQSNQVRQLNCQPKEQTYDIRESDILVSGGGGVLKHFDQLERLARLLEGNVSASRRIVDKGIAPRSIQVGQSGKTVSPKLYIALGIFGAIQHVEGLKNVENIISVNINSSAPICSLSDLVVKGDALEFIHRLSDRIERANKEGK